MKKPNVIIFYCDDLGYGDLGCYGSEYNATPTVNALAKDGVRFTNWYSNSPVCSPSRASLMTGRYPEIAGVGRLLGGERHQEGLPASELTLAKHLNNHGYRTAMAGKWHLGLAEGSTPRAHGFERFFGFMAGCVDYYSHIYYWQQQLGVNPMHDLWENETEVWRNGEYMTDMITDRAVQFIDEMQEESFFLYVSYTYNAPHYPMHAPPSYMERFSHLPWDRQVMAAMLACMDDGVGRIVGKLKDLGLYDDTMMFFSSDNGPSSETRNWLDGNQDYYYGGSAGQFRGHKGSLFDGGLKEPAILSYPARLQGGQTIDTVCAMMDVFPTILELTGVPQPDDRLLDGKSVVPVIEQSQSCRHDRIFWEYDGQLAVREGDWKLVLDGKLHFSGTYVDPVFLSNVALDSGERTNLCERHPELAARLEKLAREWYSEVTKSRT